MSFDDLVRMIGLVATGFSFAISVFLLLNSRN